MGKPKSSIGSSGSPGVLPLIEREDDGLVAEIAHRSAAPAGPLPVEAVCQAEEDVQGGPRDGGRRGKGVVVVYETGLDEKAWRTGGDIEVEVGTGGTVKDGRVEIQGDQRDR